MQEALPDAFCCSYGSAPGVCEETVPRLDRQEASAYLEKHRLSSERYFSIAMTLEKRYKTIFLIYNDGFLLCNHSSNSLPTSPVPRESAG